ncbi:unnamed protein product [Bursaphelenchus xylophilus]|uniref:(pine wood nematode) hypothetical protein n=1 Tax=Bursaphelenchus xylophilus TaxID=6326 RepID=A0A1I7RV88_BURXY|nr:unnamed protein product [Bursaphelenchus xylophilus]CAG9086537.1 unnamed protein product [Bursaphelenchus xylophilus]
MQTPFILIAATVFVGYCDLEDVNTSVLYKTVDFGKCHETCDGDLPNMIFSLLEFYNTYSKMIKICQQLKPASECVKTSNCPFASRFLLLYGGFYDLCNGKKWNYFINNEGCLRTYLDETLQATENECRLTQEIERFSHDPIVVSQVPKGQPAALTVLGRTGPLCSSMICFIPTFRRLMDEKCPGAGSVVTAAMVRPFYQGLHIVNRMGPAITGMIKVSTPPQCYPLGNKTVLHMMKRQD